MNCPKCGSERYGPHEEKVKSADGDTGGRARVRTRIGGA